MKYQPVIGLEVHVELNTKTKMFCGCSADCWGAKPNTHTCPICLGLPGALPYANREALEKCIMLGLALNCKVSPESRFERKNYFYPDLPKGYQISQYRWPLCKDGLWVMGNEKKIGINRVHQEEDTAKLIYEFGNKKSKIKSQNGGAGIDFNRSGVPLVEIVTEPDFESAEQAVEFAKAVQQMVRDLGVSNADMERGDLRLEANVSISDKEQVTSDKLPDYRVELKNINSFRFMQNAVEHEIERQTKLLEQGVTLVQETRGWNEDKKESVLQRTKEEAHDYRYFPEPDLPVIVIGTSDSQRISDGMLELSGSKSKRIEKEYGIPRTTAQILIRQGLSDYFEEVMKTDPKISALDVANSLVNKRITTDLSIEEFIEKLREIRGRQGVRDEDLEIAVLSVIKHNEKQVDAYKKGKENVLQFLIGQVMKETNGQVDAQKAREMLKEKIG